ncbi:beta-1,3-glucan-binding protein [Paraphaeosphaeria sporulosa]|uniref:Beta-1,3-glucan-binding protein n=1 Tax=Paraphaeosphaeria sporulosa TaxID=1460663 RepID=A0A177CE66_9PLEO|nr:beta-1,3-glucan-binding protein [Paraphaeosphaeria sporulosa]OAG05078.1 beta-1,3-glucan-binding protein [Paraphaeosphaeria sporulosa]
MDASSQSKPEQYSWPPVNTFQPPSQPVGAAEHDLGHGARKRHLVGRANGNADDEIDPAPIGKDTASGTPVPAPARSGSANNSTDTATTGRSPSTTKTYHPPGKAKYFKSRLIKDKSKIDKPWLYEKRDPREKWQTIIPMCGFLIGLGIAGFLIWEGYHSVSRNLYCEVMSDNFSSGKLNESVWTTEIGVKGFGSSFEQTTKDIENVWIGDDGILYLRPTLQDELLVNNDTVIDLRNRGCHSKDWTDCVATTNTTNGTIVNPVKSASVNTMLGGSIRYGRVEVTAKLPVGDWLWPSIIMYPKNNTYGEWPKSGQIDIAQSRGNNFTYKQGGNNIIASTLHFGPNVELDGWWRNNVKSTAYRETFSDRFHKFGVEWTDKYIFTYIDTRLLQVAYTHFKKPFWEYGDFPTADRNGTRFVNPWEWGTHSAPFDREFHLVLKVGVGSTNGWFEDNRSGKPWLDRDHNAAKLFWDARREWYPTWEKQGWMEISEVKMWQLAPHQGCKPENAQRFVG